MAVFPAKYVADHHLHEAFRTIMPAECGDTVVRSFEESQLDPTKVLLVVTDDGRFNVENTFALEVQMDHFPTDPL